MNKCRFLHIKLSEKIIVEKELYNTYNLKNMIWDLWGYEKEPVFLFRIDSNDLYVLFRKPIKNDDIPWIQNASITDEKIMNLEGTYSYKIVVNPIFKKPKRPEGWDRANISSITDKDTTEWWPWDKDNIPLKDYEDIEEWWRRQGEQHGFKILGSIKISNRHNDSFKNKNNNITIFKVDIQGVLETTDTELFNNSFVKGFGKSKRFGCGLMLITNKFI